METVPLPVTLATACVLALMGFVLAARVSGARRKHRVSLGDKGNDEVLLRTRIHGNFVEFVPFILILMALLEASGASRNGLMACGALLFILRLMHVVGMPRPAPNVFRAVGAGGTYLMMAGLAVWGLTLVLAGF